MAENRLVGRRDLPETRLLSLGKYVGLTVGVIKEINGSGRG